MLREPGGYTLTVSTQKFTVMNISCNRFTFTFGGRRYMAFGGHYGRYHVLKKIGNITGGGLYRALFPVDFAGDCASTLIDSNKPHDD